MGRLTLAPVMKEGFSLALAEESGGTPETVTIRFTGTADMEATALLDLFLRSLHGEASRAQLRTVVIDVSALDFMNSSCFKCFVSWIGQVAKVPAEGRYDVHFVSQPHLQWQRRSLEALHRFAPDVVTLDPGVP
jgi:hypothetical protein